jgi:hypothetical protein
LAKEYIDLGNFDYINYVQILKIKEVLWVAVIRILTDKYGHNLAYRSGENAK